MKTDDWEVVAACRGRWQELNFFSFNAEEIAACKEVCRTCPGRVGCKEFALRTKQEHGVWGGTSAEERANVHGRK